MVKATGPMFSISASGTLSNSLTFSKVKRGTACKRKSKPKDRRSDGQLSRRTSFADAVLAWQNLSDDDKDSWRELANSRGRTGYNFFISCMVGVEMVTGLHAFSAFSFSSKSLYPLSR